MRAAAPGDRRNWARIAQRQRVEVVVLRPTRYVVAALGLILSLATPGPASAAALINVLPVPNFDAQCVALGGAVIAGYCGYDPATGQWSMATPAREAAALAAIDIARRGEGLDPLVLPRNMNALTPDDQQFILVNLERVSRGLPPVTALVPELDALAQAGADAGTDPQARGSWARYPGGSNWAGDAQPAVAMYQYMYDDGWGGSAAATSNIDCLGPGAQGCWSHRRNVLRTCTPTCIMGVGTLPATADGLGSSAQIFVAYSGIPVPVAYTWTDALQAGAAGGVPSSSDPGPLWPFADLTAAPWAAGAVAFLAAEGVVRGTGPGAFDPAAPVQVQELVVLLARILGWPAEPAAAPLGTALWAAGAMGYAHARGLLPPGTRPAMPASRLQAAGLVIRALQLPAADVPLPGSDLGGLNAQDLDVLGTAVADGLLARETGGRLDPAGELTRAQAAVLLLRAVLMLARTTGSPPLPVPVQARAVWGGGVLYTSGDVRLLSPAPGADPVLYWMVGSVHEDTLLQASGEWWSGTATWTPEPVPAWAAGASLYGRAAIALWPAGQRGVGPALFRPTVQVVGLSGQVQELLPGASSWRAAPAAAETDPVRAVADALGTLPRHRC